MRASAVQCAVDPGDTTWMLISFALVLFMLPALVLFEAGLLRSKNSVSVAAQVVACLLVLSLMYARQPFAYAFLISDCQYEINQY
jgi:Amt family ammonium transporter